MAGFGIHLDLVLRKKASFHRHCSRAYPEDCFLRQFGIPLAKCQPFGHNSTPMEVLVWHTKTHSLGTNGSTFGYVIAEWFKCTIISIYILSGDSYFVFSGLRKLFINYYAWIKMEFIICLMSSKLTTKIQPWLSNLPNSHIIITDEGKLLNKKPFLYFSCFTGKYCLRVLGQMISQKTSGTCRKGAPQSSKPSFPKDVFSLPNFCLFGHFCFLFNRLCHPHSIRGGQRQIEVRWCASQKCTCEAVRWRQRLLFVNSFFKFANAS